LKKLQNKTISGQSRPDDAPAIISKISLPDGFSSSGRHYRWLWKLRLHESRSGFDWWL